ncbi:MAG TPA: ABC transporter substrate-binding protein [Actinomycetota bacterium]|nr:ABC transporter substrate-binding protein [Actinomycetota bacterium]
MTQPFAEDEDVLTVAIQEPSTLDPMRLQDPGGVLVARQLYEGLTRWDPVEEQVVPGVAESWRVDDGGRRFTFRLYEGMSFHDGSPVTSKDFKFAFERIALKRNASDIAYTLEAVEGFVAINQLGDVQHLAGIKTPDELTLVIELSRPYHDFPAVLTHPSLVPVPAAAVRDADTFLRTPVGNGPFHIAQAWSPGDTVYLRAYAGFIETPDLDGIRFVTFPDAAASWLPFLNGDLDVAEVPAGEIESAGEEFGDQAFLPFLATYNFGLNVRSPALDDLRVRRAINRAIDRETIAATIFRGSMLPARGIVPAGMPGFLENACVDVCDYAPNVATRIVDALPKKQRRVALEYSGAEPHPEVAREVRKDLREVGFEVRIRAFPFGTYLRRLQQGEQQIYRLGWIAEFPTADAFLTALFRSDSPDNHSGFRSEAVDRLLERAHATRSDAKRIQLYVEAETAILRALPIVPIGTFITHWAARPEIEGVTFDQMGGFDAVDVAFAS